MARIDASNAETTALPAPLTFATGGCLASLARSHANAPQIIDIDFPVPVGDSNTPAAQHNPDQTFRSDRACPSLEADREWAH